MATRYLAVVVLVLVTILCAREPRAQSAQKAAGVAVRVAETSGIRRNEYPVRATISVPQGVIRDASSARLLLTDKEVPAQYTAMATWPDGSIRSLDIDFNASFNPLETREYRVEYGSEVTRATAPAGRGGLTVTDEADSIQSGSIKFNKRGSPLLMSANYRAELIGSGKNGFVVTDTSGGRHELSTAQPLQVEIRKRGPLVVAIAYSGRLSLDASYAVPFTLTLEMPNSKAWLKWTAEVTDQSKRVQSIGIETPFSFGAFPFLWDVGTGNDTYGAFRNAKEAAAFTQVVEPSPKGASRWKIDTMLQGEMRPYETSLATSPIAKGWGHFMGPNHAVAFAIQDFTTTSGTYTIAFDGQGQSSFSIAHAGAPPTRRLVLYQHFVSTPVPIGAVTSPASMVQPPMVTVGK
jgi:hypothetical protein